MKNLTLEHILEACGGRFFGDPASLQKEITSVTTDSRTAGAGALFAAIPGEKADGHDFVASVFEKGALCGLVQRIPENAKGNMILVPDTVAALQAVAALYRRQFDIPVIGITGSVGKTTAKEMVASVLGQRFRVHRTAGNFNNDLGVPLTLFGLREEHEIAVIEMGVSHPGDMERLADMVRPTMALYTVIGHAHLEFLKNREGIFAEKTVMNRFLPADGTVFCSGDDDLLREMQFGGRRLLYGLGPGCDLRAENVRVTGEGATDCTLVWGDRRIDVSIRAFGEHMVYAALEGAAVGIAMGLTDEEIIRGIAAYEPVGHRARRIRTGKIDIIDDCYNANPTSVASGLRSLAACGGRKVAILGDMLELGDEIAALHFGIGTLAAALGMDAVITAGKWSEQTALGAGDRGRYFAEKAELISSLPELIREGDTVLVKASHSMKFEEITEALEAL